MAIVLDNLPKIIDIFEFFIRIYEKRAEK